MMRNAMPFLALTLLALQSRTAEAFEYLGLKSGMTATEVQSAAPLGFELRLFPSEGNLAGAGALMRGDDVFATVDFCKGRLVSVDRSIDADMDWYREVKSGAAKYGQPTIKFIANPWTGPGGGTIDSIQFVWRLPATRYTISYTPEGRDGSGNLRHKRGANVGFLETANNSCFKG